LSAFFAARRREKPGFPLQFLGPPAVDLRDFRCNPLRMGGRPLAHKLRLQNCVAIFQVCLYGFKENCDLAKDLGRARDCSGKPAARPLGAGRGLAAESPVFGWMHCVQPKMRHDCPGKSKKFHFEA
jgi:hypothetical protein